MILQTHHSTSAYQPFSSALAPRSLGSIMSCPWASSSLHLRLGQLSLCLHRGLAGTGLLLFLPPLWLQWAPPYLLLHPCPCSLWLCLSPLTPWLHLGCLSSLLHLSLQDLLCHLDFSDLPGSQFLNAPPQSVISLVSPSIPISAAPWLSPPSVLL